MSVITRTADQVPQRQHNQDRMRRADSWHRLSKEVDSCAEKFIFLWIAFNAAYGAELTGLDPDKRPKEFDKFSNFLRQIIDRDEEGVLSESLWCTFSGPIRVLMENQYTYEPFWDATRGLPRGDDWERTLRRSNNGVFQAMGKQEVHRVLTEVFSRLYTLRNQIFHGGATFSTGWGQDQVRDGSRIMAALVPVVLEIMRVDIERNLDSHIWGKVMYPRINYDRD